MLNSLSYIFEGGYFVAEKQQNSLWSVWLFYGSFMDEPYRADNLPEDIVLSSYRYHREYYW